MGEREGERREGRRAGPHYDICRAPAPVGNLGRFLGNMDKLEHSRNIGNLVGKFRYYFRLGFILSRNSSCCD